MKPRPPVPHCTPYLSAPLPGAGLRGGVRPAATVAAVLFASSPRGTKTGHTRHEAADRTCEVFQAWGGSAERSDDGSIAAVFGLPLLHENDAGLALSAALEIVEDSGAPVRIGVHTGEVVGQPLPALTGVAGSALIIARRLAEAAKPGTVLVSERTHRSARTQFVFAGPVSVAGPAGEPAVRARRMLSRHHAVPEWDVPGDPPFVGRRFDLDTVEHHLKVTARQTDAVNTTRHLRAGFAKGLGNLTPITFNREG